MATETTLRMAVERARNDQQRILTDYNQGTPLRVELSEGRQPEEDVLHFWAVLLRDGSTRVGIIYLMPGRDGSTYLGADLAGADAPRWFSRRGVPTVRLSHKSPRVNSRSTH